MFERIIILHFPVEGCKTPFFHSFIRSFNHSFIHSFVQSFIQSFVCSFIRSFIHSFIHSFVQSFIHSFVHSFIHTRGFCHILGKSIPRLCSTPGKIVPMCVYMYIHHFVKLKLYQSYYSSNCIFR